MSIHILNIENATDSKIVSTVHLMPCKIYADCDASVKKYFDSYVENMEDGKNNLFRILLKNKILILFVGLQCYFRGRKLNGIHVSAPENYKGVILQETIKPLTEKQQRKFYVTKNFNQITFWNWDKKPSKNDTFQQALEWIDIAEAVSSEIL